MRYVKQFEGMARDELEAICDAALNVASDLAEANRRLDSCRQRCAKLLSAREGIHLPGWDCPQCGAFNGSAKEILTHCRGCGIPKS